MQAVADWIRVNWFELTAAALGLVCIFLQIRQKALYWIISILMVGMYIWIYYNEVLYADLLLQLYYLAVSIYGFWAWTSGKKSANGRKLLKVSRLPHLSWWWLSVSMIAAFIVLGFILEQYTASVVPWLDAFVTSLSFAATWMLARKKIENWILWIIADAVSCYMYLIKEMYPTLILFVVLTFLAFVGYVQWKKELNASASL